MFGGEFLERIVGKVAVAARACEHRELSAFAAVVPRDENAGAVDVEERGNLGENTLREPLHRLEIEEGRGRLDDDLQTATGLREALKLLIAPQRRGQGREKLVRGEFGLGLIVVDVAFDDDPALGRLSRLAGPQNDAHGLVLELLADVVDEFEPGDVRFHDDVEENHSHIRLPGQKLPALGRRIGGKDPQALPVQGIIIKGEPGAFVNRVVVIDDGDGPGLYLVGSEERRLVIHELKYVLVTHHNSSPCSSSQSRRGLPWVATPILSIMG